MPGVANYTTMMLSPDGRVLYVGAREMLLALNTRAFSPGPQHQQVSPGALVSGSPSLVQRGSQKRSWGVVLTSSI